LKLTFKDHTSVSQAGRLILPPDRLRGRAAPSTIRPRQQRMPAIRHRVHALQNPRWAERAVSPWRPPVRPGPLMAHSLAFPD
jgi:hypothetical protein